MRWRRIVDIPKKVILPEDREMSFFSWLQGMGMVTLGDLIAGNRSPTDMRNLVTVLERHIADQTEKEAEPR